MTEGKGFYWTRMTTNMIVLQYAGKFIELSKFVPQFVASTFGLSYAQQTTWLAASHLSRALWACHKNEAS